MPIAVEDAGKGSSLESINIDIDIRCDDGGGEGVVSKVNIGCEDEVCIVVACASR